MTSSYTASAQRPSCYRRETLAHCEVPKQHPPEWHFPTDNSGFFEPEPALHINHESKLALNTPSR
jgi:hypothetical protein